MEKVFQPSQMILATRIVSGGKITSLASNFALKDNMPFSIYLRPKSDSDSTDAIVEVKAFQNNDFAELPFALNDWSPILVKEIKASNSLLQSYDIYWGSGYYATVNE